ncbi:MAG TPA: hypothetical protein VIL85_20985 [Thermomicrobiales bacterium]|jgi:hypothetical protein
MYAFTTRVALRPGQGDEGTRRWRDEILPWLRQQRGFRRLMVLNDDAGTRGLAILFFDSEADYQAAGGGLGDLAKRLLRPLIDETGQHLDEGFTLALDA